MVFSSPPATTRGRDVAEAKTGSWNWAFPNGHGKGRERRIYGFVQSIYDGPWEQNWVRRLVTLSAGRGRGEVRGSVEPLVNSGKVERHW